MKTNRFYIPLIAFLFMACDTNFTPKPRGFSRIDFPQKDLVEASTHKNPFSFKHPSYCLLKYETSNSSWFDLKFVDFNGTLHMSYKQIYKNLNKYTEESRDLAYKHAQKAEAITEQRFVNDSLKVYGMVYTFEGATATPLQFYLSDSTSHFVRGALYFNTALNDSIKPISNFIKDDVYQLIESWQWKGL